MFSQRSLVRLGAIPEEPTVALPGSEEKIQVMIQRASRRQRLFHPMDGPRAKLFRPTVEVSPPRHFSERLPNLDGSEECGLDWLSNRASVDPREC
jgi:hypothetical protein